MPDEAGKRNSTTSSENLWIE